VLKNAGFQIHHEHNHCGKCWWEFRRSDDPASASLPKKLSGENDVRARADWIHSETRLDQFAGATGPLEKNHRPGQDRSGMKSTALSEWKGRAFKITRQQEMVLRELAVQ